MGLSWLKRKGAANILLRFLLPERGDHKGRIPNATHRRDPLETWRCQVFPLTGRGFCLLAGSSAEKGQRKDQVCMWVRVVPEDDAFRLVQCDGDLSKNDSSDEHNGEKWEYRDVLRG